MMKLAIAECTAHDAAYLVWACWDTEHRQTQEQAVRLYNDFLDKHSDLFSRTEPISDVALIWPYDNWLDRNDCPTADLAQHLSASNIQYDPINEAELSSTTLSKYTNAMWAAGEPPQMLATRKLLSRFGAKAFELPAADPALAAAMAELAKSASVSIAGVAGVRASVRKSVNGCVLHLYNLNVVRQDSYHDSVEPAGAVEVSWLLPKGVGTAGLKLNCLTPDPEGSSGRLSFTATKVGNRARIIFTVPKLHIWSVITAEPN